MVICNVIQVLPCELKHTLNSFSINRMPILSNTGVWQIWPASQALTEQNGDSAGGELPTLENGRRQYLPSS